MNNKQTFTRQEVRELLKRQIAKVRNSIGRMPHTATEDEVFLKVAKCRLIKF